MSIQNNTTIRRTNTETVISKTNKTAGRNVTQLNISNYNYNKTLAIINSMIVYKRWIRIAKVRLRNSLQQ